MPALNLKVLSSACLYAFTVEAGGQLEIMHHCWTEGADMLDDW